jgi:hypothetical protein
MVGMSIPQFGLAVTFLLYSGLLLAEYLRPGFVSTALNVHVLWVVMVAWIIGEKGVWGRSWAARGDARFSRMTRGTMLIVSLLAAVVIALVVWKVGAVFGDMRLLFSVTMGMLVVGIVRSFLK